MITRQYFAIAMLIKQFDFFSFERLQRLKVLKVRKRSWHRLCFIILVEKYGWEIQKSLFA